MTAAVEPSAARDELAVNAIRTLAMDAVQAAKSGHPGAPMGLAPLGYVLHTRVLRHNPANPAWPNRDRFLLSGGHASMLQYALLHLCGYDLPLEQIKRFRQWGSRTPGHPEYGVTPGVEATTGPLGQGVANAVGLALGERHLASRFDPQDQGIVDWRTYFTCGDGDMQEGVASEAASLAGNLGLGKLTGVYDDNHIQIEGSTEIAFCERVAQRFEAYGWHVQALHEDVTLEGIELALAEAASVTDRPSLIVLRTHIGYGSPHKQDSADAHGSPLGEEEVRLTKQALGWPSEQPFEIPPEAREAFAGVAQRGAELERAWSERYEAWAHEHPDLAKGFERLVRDDVLGTRDPAEPHAATATRTPAPALADESTPTFPADAKGVATRVASGRALNWLAPLVPELLGGAADLAPSTETQLDGAGDILRHAFGGRNLHFGVREHAMGAIVNGLALTGLRAVWSHLPRLLRLHAPADPARGADGDPLDLRLHARLGRDGRGRADAPADRAARGAACDARARRDPPGRPQRDVPGVARGSRGERPDRDRALAPGAAGARPGDRPGRRRRARRLCVARAQRRGARRGADRDRLGGRAVPRRGRPARRAVDRSTRGLDAELGALRASAASVPRKRAATDDRREAVGRGCLALRLGAVGRRARGEHRAGALRRLRARPRGAAPARLHARGGREPRAGAARTMMVAVGFDHAGVALRDAVMGALAQDGHAVVDAGTYDDYPLTALAVGSALDGGAERGIAVCGSGAGVAVAASKLPGVRAATVHDTYTAHQCVEHDDVTILCLGARVIGPELASEIVQTFTAARFGDEPRHRRRLAQVAAIERGDLDDPELAAGEDTSR